MSKHLKRLAAPRPWTIARKEHKWAVRPVAGPHPLRRSVPLLVVIRDMLGYADIAREGKHIIHSRSILRDGVVVTDPKYPIGLMDVLGVPAKKENFRVLLDRRGKIRLIKVPAKMAGWKLARIENKTTVKGGATQLNLHDGRNILVDDDKYKTGDTLKLELVSQKILETFPMKKDACAMIIGGKHIGEIATINKLETIRSPKPNRVHFKEGFSTTNENVFIIGHKTPEINLPEVSQI